MFFFVPKLPKVAKKNRVFLVIMGGGWESQDGFQYFLSSLSFIRTVIEKKPEVQERVGESWVERKFYNHRK